MGGISGFPSHGGNSDCGDRGKTKSHKTKSHKSHSSRKTRD